MLASATSRQMRPTLIVRLLRPFAALWFRATGFRIVGEMPDVPKFIIVAAPHRTNWDLPHCIAAGLHYGLRVHWLGKASLFKWPYNGAMRWLGGIPIDRSKSNNAVAAMVAEFDRADRLVVAIPPSGTRKQVTRWKSGFYHIAVGAKIPLALCFIDYTGRQIGVAEVFYPSGNYEADLAKILAVYKPYLGDQTISVDTPAAPAG
jgi:1-acyl-sn-glycerol-3-phosphate acyltransferase